MYSESLPLGSPLSLTKLTELYKSECQLIMHILYLQVHLHEKPSDNQKVSQEA